MRQRKVNSELGAAVHIAALVALPLGRVLPWQGALLLWIVLLIGLVDYLLRMVREARDKGAARIAYQQREARRSARHFN